MKSLIAALLLFLCFPVAAQDLQPLVVSPLRFRGETFEGAIHRQMVRQPSSNSAFGSRRKLGRLDQVLIPRWKSATPIDVAFKEIRDRRTLADESRPDFLRRLSWLFPDDGCYLRAEIAAEWLEERGYPTPAKIFVFGDLNAQTEHHPDGEVEWWYHVVVGYKTDKGLLVFDPAVNAGHPLTLKEWSDKMGTKDLTFSFCDRNSVDPYSDCVGGERQSAKKTSALEQTFLDQEWERQIELSRDPSRVLGEEPPWLVPGTNLLVP